MKLLILLIAFGTATFYHNWFNGRLTASSEVFKQNKLTAAHMTLKFGTKVKITNLANNKSVIVKVNDRGAFKHNNFDLSKSAFKKIASLKTGVIKIKWEIVK